MPCRQYCLHLQSRATSGTICYHTYHYEPLSSSSCTAIKLNRFTERITCLSLRISIHGFNSDTLHTEILVQNIANVVLQSSDPTCSQHTSYRMRQRNPIVFLKYGSLVVHGLNPTICPSDKLLPRNANISSHPKHIMFLKT